MTMSVGIRTLLLTVMVCTSVLSQSIDDQLMDSATNLEDFNSFRVTPDGRVNILQEMDMILTLDQYRKLFMDDNHNLDGTRRSKRKAVVDQKYVWPSCYFDYELDNSLDTETKNKIKWAMSEWHKYSCVIFRERPSASNRVRFTNGSSCTSFVGRQGSVQTLTLARGCRTKPVILHEIGHAVGLMHEHQRRDREGHVSVAWDDIPVHRRKDYSTQYRQDVITNYDIPYDFKSIMHYGRYMSADNVDRGVRLGEQTRLSFEDIKAVNLLNGCAKVFCSSKRNCGPGFQLSKSFKGHSSCKCWCDSGDPDDPLVLCSQQKTVTSLPPLVNISWTSSSESCRDERRGCRKWKSEGKCRTKAALMSLDCPKTCGFCGKAPKEKCFDYDTGCSLMGQAGYCEDPGLKALMHLNCRVTCGLCEAQSAFYEASSGAGLSVSSTRPIGVKLMTFVAVFFRFSSLIQTSGG